MEEVFEVIAEQSVPDKCKFPPIHEIHSQLNSEMRDPGLCNQNSLTLTLQIEEAEKTGWKEKLHWYYYSEEFEKKVITIALESNISDQMARTQIYDEIEPYLSGRKAFYPEAEGKLYTWVIEQRKQELAVTYMILQVKMQEIMETPEMSNGRIVSQIQFVIRLRTEKSFELVNILTVNTKGLKTVHIRNSFKTCDISNTLDDIGDSNKEIEDDLEITDISDLENDV
ncbi:17343_t:CDS:2, partial [Funneliformis geosporum]